MIDLLLDLLLMFKQLPLIHSMAQRDGIAGMVSRLYKWFWNASRILLLTG
jgi:hypothetical protein